MMSPNTVDGAVCEHSEHANIAAEEIGDTPIPLVKYWGR